MHTLHVSKKLSKISIYTTNGGQKDFELDLMKGYNINSFLKKEKFLKMNLDYKIKSKAHNILWKFEKNVETRMIKLFTKSFKKKLMKIKKVFYWMQ